MEDDSERSLMMRTLLQNATEIIQRLWTESPDDMFFYGYGALAGCRAALPFDPGSRLPDGYLKDFYEVVIMAKLKEIRRDPAALSFACGAIMTCISIAQDLAAERREVRRKGIRLVHKDQGQGDPPALG